MEYPRFVYKLGSPVFTATANNDEERAQLLADGWKDSVPELYETAAEIAEKAAVEEKEVADDNAPPTRAELEAKAKELGLQFHHRTGDTKLADMIDKAIRDGLE